MSPSTVIQILTLLLASAAFALAFQLGLRHMRAAAAGAPGTLGSVQPGELGSGAVSAISAGVVTIAVLLLWRLTDQGQAFFRLEHHFDSFLVLGLLLAGMLVYFRLTQHLRGLGFFLLPPIAMVLLLGAVLTLVSQDRQYNYDSATLVVHVASIMVGSVCFALSCAGGAVYLLADRQLRRKGLDRSHRFLAFPSLATLERFNQIVTLIGFPLLTFAVVTGFLRAYRVPPPQGAEWAAAPKVLLALVAWLVYGLVLYIRLAPSFRGRRAAWLNIAGFVLLLGVYVAAGWWPHG